MGNPWMKFRADLAGLARATRWGWLCWGTALFLVVSVALDFFLHPGAPFLFPNTFSDSLLYTFFIQRASDGFLSGDPFLWEHRHDPSSLISIFHFWPSVYGQIFRMGGYAALMVVSLFLSGLWFYSLFRLCLKLGHPRAYAFFVAGIQTFFVVNFAYQFVGFKTNLALYNFWITEHVRLYPTVTAMAFYSLAVLLVLHATEKPSWRRVACAALGVALVIYGRPFDWMVLVGGIAMLAFIAGLRGQGRMLRACLLILVFSTVLSIPFFKTYFSFQASHGAEYLDQMARGNLQVKLPAHYVKYAVLCLFLGGGLVLAFREILWRKRRSPEMRRDDEPVAFLLVFSLGISGLLAHFKSAMEGGVTLVGFSYFMVFSVIPWFFLLLAHKIWLFFGARRAEMFRSRQWMYLLWGLLLIQQVGLGVLQRAKTPTLVVPPERHAVYHWITRNGGNQSTVLSLARGVEVGVFTGAWSFFTNPVVETYTCSAPTSELLDRILLAKIICTGTLEDLAPLFDKSGMPGFETWKSSQPGPTQFWLGMVEEAIGHNTFVFHPIKNRGEIKVRKMAIPDALLAQGDFFAYFPPSLRTVFERRRECCLKYRGLAGDFFREILGAYKLDYIYVPRSAMVNVDPVFLERIPGIQEIRCGAGMDGHLWRIGRP